MSEVQDKIFDIIAKEATIDRAKINPASTLKDLQIPSLDMVQIFFALFTCVTVKALNCTDADADFERSTRRPECGGRDKPCRESRRAPDRRP